MYTHKDRNERNYTVGDAIAQAKIIATARNLGPVCLNALSQPIQLDRLISLVQLNDLVESIVADTIDHF